MIYNGEALRIYCKFFYNDSKPGNYIGIQAEYSYLWFDNASFMDQVNPDPEVDNDYTMSEKTHAFGFDVIIGREIEVSDILHLDIFYGLGLRTENRAYTVLTSTSILAENNSPLNYQYPNSISVGSYKTSMGYPVPILGFKLGVNLFRKKDKAAK